MKNSRILPASGLIGCIGALALRLGQNRTGFEAQTGLAVPGNLFAVVLPIFLLLCAGTYAVLSRSLPARQEASSFRAAFPAGNRALLLPAAAGAALWLISGVIELDPNDVRLAPLAPATRAQVAVMLHRFLTL